MKWVLMAYVIACPIAWIVMNVWFQHFAFHTGIAWWIFALVGFCTVVIAMFTVSWQSYRAATRAPVAALKYE